MSADKEKQKRDDDGSDSDDADEQETKDIDLFEWRAAVPRGTADRAEAFMKRMLEGDNIENEFKKVKMSMPTPSGHGAGLASIRKNFSRPLSEEEMQRLETRKPKLEAIIDDNERGVAILDEYQATQVCAGLEPSRYVVPVELCHVEPDDDPDGNCFLFVFGRAYVISTSAPWFMDICQREADALERITTNPLTGDPDKRMIYILDEAIYSRFNDLPREVRPYLYPKLAFLAFLEVCMGGYDGVREYMNSCANAYQFAVEMAYLIAINFDHKMADYVVDYEFGGMTCRTTKSRAARPDRPPPTDAEIYGAAASIVKEAEAAIAEVKRGAAPGSANAYDVSKHNSALHETESQEAEPDTTGLLDANYQPMPPRPIYTRELADEIDRAMAMQAENSEYACFIDGVIRLVESKVPTYVQADTKATAARLKRLVCSIPFFLERNLLAMEQILVHYSHLSQYSSKFNPRTHLGLFHFMKFFTDTHMTMLIYSIDAAIYTDNLDGNMYETEID